MDVVGGMSLPALQSTSSAHSLVLPPVPSFMACYASHNRIIRFMRVMTHVEKAICMFPSSILPGICMEANFCEPVYVECSEERFRFQFTAHVKADVENSSANWSDFKATGFSFRDKADALESAALAALEFLLHHYGVSYEQYSDSVFTDHWPLYDHLSRHREKSRTNLSRLMDDLVSLTKSIEQSFKLFENSKSLLNMNPEYAADVSLLDVCLNELQNIHGFLSSDIKPCLQIKRLCLSNRRDNHDCHEAVRYRQTEVDIKLKCSSTLKLTLDKLCECTGYSVESISCSSVSEKSYTAEISLLDESTSTDHPSRLRIGSGKFAVSSEAECVALYRAICSLSRRGGYKIIDPGYIFLRDMQRDTHALKYDLPFFCNFVVQLKCIAQRGLKSTDSLAQKYYRELRRHPLLSELRIPLADCISEFAYILKSLDEELVKIETYSGDLPSCGSFVDVM